MNGTGYDGPGDMEIAQLEQTRNLIDYDHQTIVIERPPALVVRKDKSVERKGVGTTLAPQLLYFGGVSMDDRREVNFEGERIISDWVLVGLPSASFQEGDTFRIWGRKFLVLEVHEDKRWQRKAWCVARG